MATPSLSKHTLAGSLGEILVDVRTAGRESPRPAVLVVHGFKGFKDWGMFPPLAERLANAGFTSVSFNLSGSAVDDTGAFIWSERFGHNTFSAELADLATVLDALTNGRLGVRPPSKIGVVGHSRGGGMAVLLAARDPRVLGLVTWAAIATVDRWPGQKEEWRSRGRLDVVNARTGQVLPLFTDVLDDVEQHQTTSLDILGAAARVQVPWLVVHGTADTSVDPAEARQLARASSRDTTRLLLIPEADHTFGTRHPFQGATPQFERAREETLSWLASSLG